MQINSIIDCIEDFKDASEFAEFSDLEDCSYSGVRCSDIESASLLDVAVWTKYGASNREL
jgi:hypothetical protein